MGRAHGAALSHGYLRGLPQVRTADFTMRGAMAQWRNYGGGDDPQA